MGNPSSRHCDEIDRLGLHAGGVPGDPEEPGLPDPPTEPGVPTVPDQPPPAPVA